MREQNESNSDDLLFIVMDSVAEAYFEIKNKCYYDDNSEYSINVLMNSKNIDKFYELINSKRGLYNKGDEEVVNGIKFSIGLHDSDEILIKANQINISLIEGKFDMFYRNGICIVVNY